jgi:transcription elongation factor Elf1
MGKSLEQLLLKTRQALRTIRHQPIRGNGLRCPKCGHVPLSWTKEKEWLTPDTWAYTFLCFRCKLRDTIILKGIAPGVIDAYCLLCDRFFDAIKPKPRVELEEEMQPLQKQL